MWSVDFGVKYIKLHTSHKDIKQTNNNINDA